MFLTKYRPHRGFDSLLKHPAFEGFFEDAAAGELTRSPLTNIQELDDSFVLTLEVPGLDRKDIDVSVENDHIVIKGEKVEEEKVEAKGLLRREIRSAKFHRSFRIGDKIDRGSIKAKLDNGVLTVTLKKTEEQAGRKVDVD